MTDLKFIGQNDMRSISYRSVQSPRNEMIRILWLVLLGLLSGCNAGHIQNNPPMTAHSKTTVIKKDPHNEHDGPPPGPLPVLFKKVTPVNAPLSRYGNPDAYRVDGHTYEVMTSSSGYRTRGLASWYGTKFHSRRTSSGEDYDMYALTAAHKTLPLPTYVRVKNLSNGRVAIVKVNDRGPFHRGRVIDLSYAAAAKLGLFPKGTAPVEIEALTSTAKGHPNAAHYYLQAGAFASSQLAQSLHQKLSKLTPSPVFIEKYQGRYLVRVGPFAEKSMVKQLQTALTKNGVNGSFSLLM